MLSTPELCKLVDRSYAWAQMRRLRAREKCNRRLKVPRGARASADRAISGFPVKSLEGVRWARYDAADVLNVATAVAGEDSGLTFEAAALLAHHGNASAALTREGTYHVARITALDGRVRYCGGALDQVVREIASSGPVGVAIINVTAVLQQVRLRADALGLTEKLRWSQPPRSVKV
jgi:hypothetical protein